MFRRRIWRIQYEEFENKFEEESERKLGRNFYGKNKNLREEFREWKTVVECFEEETYEVHEEYEEELCKRIIRRSRIRRRIWTWRIVIKLNKYLNKTSLKKRNCTKKYSKNIMNFKKNFTKNKSTKLINYWRRGVLKTVLQKEKK